MKVDPAGKPSRTAYRTLGVAPHVALVAMRAETGRTHQLRVHLAAAGHPIVGDDLYGGPRHHGVRDRALRRLLDPGRPLLHAWRLTLPSPPLEAASTLEAPWPADLGAVLDRCGWREALASHQMIW
jgi:23S rRNA pseudouridine1911/1915/1917 synthase